MRERRSPGCDIMVLLRTLRDPEVRVAVPSGLDMERRAVVHGTGRLALLGIIASGLPTAAAAASPDTQPAGVRPVGSIERLTVDDTVEPTAGHQRAFRVTASASVGSDDTGPIIFGFAVRVDDGTDSGAGGRVPDATIDGELTDERSITSTTETATFSLTLPRPGSYLVRFTSDPVALQDPDGILLSLVTT